MWIEWVREWVSEWKTFWESLKHFTYNLLNSIFKYFPYRISAVGDAVGYAHHLVGFDWLIDWLVGWLVGANAKVRMDVNKYSTVINYWYLWKYIWYFWSRYLCYHPVLSTNTKYACFFVFIGHCVGLWWGQSMLQLCKKKPQLECAQRITKTCPCSNIKTCVQ